MTIEVINPRTGRTCVGTLKLTSINRWCEKCRETITPNSEYYFVAAFFPYPLCTTCATSSSAALQNECLSSGVRGEEKGLEAGDASCGGGS